MKMARRVEKYHFILPAHTGRIYLIEGIAASWQKQRNSPGCQRRGIGGSLARLATPLRGRDHIKPAISRNCNAKKAGLNEARLIARLAAAEQRAAAAGYVLSRRGWASTR
jgi:hypothetical protein